MTIIGVKALSKMKVKEWDDRLGDIRYWKMKQLPGQKPGALFTIRFQPNFPGYEHIFSEHHVDQVWLDRADGDEEYVIDYIRRFFGAYLHQLRDTIMKRKQKIINHASNLASKPLLPHDHKVSPEIKERKHKLRKMRDMKR